MALIENYEAAVADQTQTWEIHHRRESTESRDYLIAMGEYYGRPASELIFLRRSEHNRLHNVGKPCSDETRAKIGLANSISLKGRPSPMKGRRHSEEAKRKIGEAARGRPCWLSGKHHSEETKAKLREHRHTDETKARMKASHSGSRWWNDGTRELCVRECPEGFVPGRLRRRRK